MAVAAQLMVWTASPALADTTTTNSPQTVCSGGGPYLEVVNDQGQVFHGGSQYYTDHNGTTKPETDTFTTSWTGTIASTVGATLSVSFGFIVTTVKADINVSVTQSTAVTTSHAISFVIPVNWFGHAQYGAWQRHVTLQQYYQTKACSDYNAVNADSYLNDGVGWETSTSASS